MVIKMTTITEYYKERFEEALSDFASHRENFSSWQRQFEGSTEIPGGIPARLGYNFTKELIEAQINPNIPMPLVTPRHPSEKNTRLARVIEAMIRCEMDRMPFERMNDAEERISRIMGGSVFFVEWDNSLHVGESVGGLSVRTLSPLEFIPQPGVVDTDRMDYFFLVFEDTKERLYKRYGIKPEEGVDVRLGDKPSNERVTQVICYFKNDRGGLGVLSWAGDTELYCNEDYHLRKLRCCTVCGKVKVAARCECGSDKFERRTVSTDYRSGVQKQRPKRDKKGKIILSSDGTPTMEGVDVPYYSPSDFPVAVRRNNTLFGRFFGGSDCEAITGLQQQANKALSKIDEKIACSGYIMTKPDNMQFELSNKMGRVLSVTGPDQIDMLKSIAFEFDADADYTVIKHSYEMARAVLGITDSFLGNADSSATSGKAKELLMSRTIGIQQTKQMLKNSAYADLFRCMFRFMLSFADEPRGYTATDADGKRSELIFDRGDFLSARADGSLYYEDDFVFSVDESGTIANNRRFMLEDVRTDFGLGAFGNPQMPQTLLLYWKEKEALGYPNAGRMVHHWTMQVEKQKGESETALPEMQVDNAPEQLQGRTL